jgi:phage terminase large subunit
VKWVMQMVLQWGPKHPLVVSKCFGQFPEEDSSVLISLGMIEKSQLREREVMPTHARVSIGVDVARFGSDKTVITKIKGNQMLEKRVLVKRDSNHISGVLCQMIAEEPSINIHIVVDGTGVGSGVVDAMNENVTLKVIPNYIQIHEVHFGSSAAIEGTSEIEQDKMKAKFVNLKARIFVELGEALKKDLCLIEDDELPLELPTIKYKFDSKGRWQIESKDEYRARTGRSSPDSADSLALANFGRTDAIGGSSFSEEMNNNSIKTLVPSRMGGDLW